MPARGSHKGMTPRRNPFQEQRHAMLDIDGFLTSPEFLVRLAVLISAVFSAIFGSFINSLFRVA